MGSVGNTNPWAPYNTYKDCSQGICSIYCPQYCYLIFPPPPSGGGGTHFSPLIIAVISVLASALLLVIYYTLVTRFCRGRSHGMGVLIEEDRENSTPRDPCHVVSIGLDEKTIKAIAVTRYRKGGMVIEGSECVVCLSEFQENEPLRVLPKCNHAFHLPCVDTWLASHSVCPLCRTNVAVAAPQPPQIDSRPSNTIIEVDNRERMHSEQADANFSRNGSTSQENPVNTADRARRNEQGEIKQFRRSNSLGALPCSCSFSSLNMSKMGQWAATKDECPGSIDGSSKELGVKRSFSTGRLMCTDCNKGKKSILPY